MTRKLCQLLSRIYGDEIDNFLDSLLEMQEVIIPGIKLDPEEELVEIIIPKLERLQKITDIQDIEDQQFNQKHIYLMKIRKRIVEAIHQYDEEEEERGDGEPRLLILANFLISIDEIEDEVCGKQR